MPDAIFAHPRLAPIYDAFGGDRDGLPAYLDLVEELRADRVLEAREAPDRPGREFVFIARG